MFSIIMPMDTNRLEQFANTKRAYDEMEQVKEFIIPTRSWHKLTKYLKEHKLNEDVQLIPYKVEVGFNPSKALNIGVRNAKYENIIITSPEVKPTTDVLKQLSERLDENIICEVADQDADGNLSVLVSTNFRGKTPAMYFLAMFQKKDIEAINGWDEEFMRGYAYEDDDFGERWMRAGIPFVIAEDIRAVHQYHPRTETVKGGLTTNLNTYRSNTEKGIIQCMNGLTKR